MNTYNENLSASVLASLQSQELQQKKVYSQLNAAMFTLYYAEGATIDATDKLNAAADIFHEKSNVKNQAVNCSNISNNELRSADQANQYLKQSITNTAVCASNIQVASNAILRLASDVGSIYSIVKAADYHTDIYTQVKEARKLMDETAYSAEMASQHAMEASMSTSGVSGATVLDLSKSTNTLMNTVLKIATTDFDNSAQALAASYGAMMTVSAEEKTAEGAFEDISVDYKATTAAYHASNSALNLNLLVPATDITNNSFKVQFHVLTTPFEDGKAKPYYPAKDYYLFVAKETQKLNFTLSQAMNLQNSSRQAIKVALPQPYQYNVSQQVMVVPENANGVALQDTDGDEIKLGVDYVVFVLAIYMDEYKRRLNDFDDFLSAPSESFALTNKLNAVEASAIAINPIDPNSQQPADTKALKDGNIYKLTFQVKEDADFKVDYRCIFLPESGAVNKGLLNAPSLKSLNEEIETLQKIADELDPKIAELQAKLSQKSVKHQLQMQYDDLSNQITNTDDQTQAEKLKAELTSIGGKLYDLQQEYKTDRDELKKLFQEKESVVKNLGIRNDDSPVGFFFNVDIAQQVPAGNFTSAIPDPSFKTEAANSDKNSDQKVSGWMAYIGPETTDNFGNMLQPGTYYIPAIVSVSAGPEEDQPEFKSNISDITATASFVYSNSETINKK